MRKLSQEEEKPHRELFAKGLNDREIAGTLGVASTTIANWRHRRGLSPNYYHLFEPKTPERRQFEYLLGVIHGDGYVRDDGKSCEIAIPVSSDEKGYKNILKETFEREYGYTPRERIHNNCYYLTIHPKKIVEQFRYYKVNGGWIIPKLEYPSEYLAGLWDTDGYFYFHEGMYKKIKNGRMRICVCTRRRIELRQKSNGNLKLIVPLLKSLGFSPWIGSYTYTNKLGTFRNDIVIVPSSNYALFKSTVPLKHPRKKEVLEKIVDYKPRWKNRWGGVGGSKLTPIQISQSGILHRIGLTQKEIAKLFNVSCTTIRKHAASNGHKNVHAQREVFLALEIPKKSKDICHEVGISRRCTMHILNGLKLRGLVTRLPSSFYGLTREGKRALIILKTCLSEPKNLEAKKW